MNMIADHLGHSVNIHTSIYKLQQQLIEKSKVAKILIAIEEGNIHKLDSATETDIINMSDIHIAAEDSGTSEY